MDELLCSPMYRLGSDFVLIDADLRKGDIIEAIDGNKITDPPQVSPNIRKRSINERIVIMANRYGKRYDCRIQLLARA